MIYRCGGIWGYREFRTPGTLTKKKGGPGTGPPFVNGPKPGLPVELEPHLDLARQNVLRRHRGRNHAAEVRVLRVGLEIVAAEVVVIENIERLEAGLEAHALVDPGGLQKRHIPLEGVVDADLAGTERRVPRREGGGLQPRVVAEVVAEVRAAAQTDAGRCR